MNKSFSPRYSYLEAGVAPLMSKAFWPGMAGAAIVLPAAMPIACVRAYRLK